VVITYIGVDSRRESLKEVEMTEGNVLDKWLYEYEQDEYAEEALDIIY
jgi:hypothetical protein